MEPSANSPCLSQRSSAVATQMRAPWRLATAQTYDAKTNPQGLISFALAENKLVIGEVADFVKKVARCEAEQLTYDFSVTGARRFRAALAVHLNEYFQPHEHITAEHIEVVDSAKVVLEILAWALADLGDGVLTSRPVYGRFELDFGNRARVDVIYADTCAETCFDEDVVDKFEDAVTRSKVRGVKIKAVLIVNPHNPLGRCYPRKTLIAIMKFCQRRELHLISDEIYACSTFDSGEPLRTPFTSVLAIDCKGMIDPRRVHVVYGFSKDFASAGLRLGAVITRSQAVKCAVADAKRFHNAAGPSLAIGIAMLEDREWCRDFLEASRQRLADAYRHVTRGLRDVGIDYLSGSNAGFFVWIDLSPYLPKDFGGEPNAEFAMAKKLAESGVFLHPREEHSLKPGWYRLVYTQDPDVVTEGLKRIKMAISQPS